MATQLLMTSADNLSPQRNRLLESLNPGDMAALAPNLIYVELDGGQCLSTLSVNVPVVCFPLSLVASIVQVMADGSRFEVALVGSEGVIGWSSVVDEVQMPQAALAQLDGGAALVVAAPIVAQLCVRSATLHAALLAFVRSLTVQMSHTIVANLRDGIEQRLARWLLMLHDRVDGDVLALTHGDLAQALHVRRASITDTLHILEGDRILRCTRGQLTIRDRAALEAVAGNSYGPAEATYRALVGDFGKS